MNEIETWYKELVTHLKGMFAGEHHPTIDAVVAAHPLPVVATLQQDKPAEQKTSEALAEDFNSEKGLGLPPPLPSETVSTK